MTTFHIEIPADIKRNQQEEVEVDWAAENPTLSKILEGCKLVFSSCIVTILLIVIFVGIINNWCVLSLPPIGLFIILFGCLILLAYVEALHYACKYMASSLLPISSHKLNEYFIFVRCRCGKVGHV